MSAAASRAAAPQPFEAAAPAALEDARVRANVLHATTSIRAKRAAVVAEVPDWHELREAASAIRASSLERLDELLVSLESAVVAAGGEVHWAADAAVESRTAIELENAILTRARQLRVDTARP